MFEIEDNVLTTVLSKYKRTIESFQEDVDIIRKWIQSQPHFPEIMDDDRIKNFLLLNKCSIEKTKEKIDNYYTMRTLIPELYLDVDLPEVKKSVEIGYWLALPKLTHDFSRVIVIKLRRKDLIHDLDPNVYHARENHLQEIRLKEDIMFQDIAIVDLEGYNWNYILKVTPTVVSKIIAIFENVYSNRMQAIYIINPLPTIHTILEMVKGVMKPKIFQRIHVHKYSKILLEVFPKEILPKDYGGDERSLEELHDLQIKKMSEYSGWLKKLNAMKVDENLRPGKLRNDEILGFYGNFKKLNVD